MHDSPKVSVIIPAFNAQEFIAEALDSVLAQTYPNIQIVVVDDGSTDLTLEVVQRYGSRVVLHRQENCGVSCARNAGIRISTGKFLCFLDADDMMVPERVSMQIDFMGRHDSVGLVFSDYQNFSESGFWGESHFKTCPILWRQIMGLDELVIEDPLGILAQENFGIAGSFLMRRKLLELVPGFEPTLKGGEDFHFYFRLAMHSPVGIINTTGLMRRRHESNTTRNSAKMLNEYIRGRNMLRDCVPDREVQKSLSRYVARCKVALGRCYADNGCYLEALNCNWQVLSGPFFWPEIRGASRNMVHTVLLAVGYYRGKRSVET